MPIYFDNKSQSWYVVYRFKDAMGKEKQSTKRGFSKKRDAKAWESEFNLKKDKNMDMTFQSFCEIYLEHVYSEDKISTYITIESRVRNNILPFLRIKRLVKLQAMMLTCGRTKLKKVKNMLHHI